MMNQTDDAKLAPVAATPQQAGEARTAWWWVERSVWTERMLTRLTSGETADRVWFRLRDKTYAPANLQSAYDKVMRNGGSAGADQQTLAHFGRRAGEELQRLHEQLREGTYEPQPVRRAKRAESPCACPAGVRASVVAAKRVTTVEPRDAGRWKCEGQKDGKENQRECPRGLTGGGISRVPLAWVIPNV